MHSSSVKSLNRNSNEVLSDISPSQYKRKKRPDYTRLHLAIILCILLQLEIAKKCGADVTLNPNQCNVVEEVMNLTCGYGCDVYIEATGHPSSVKQG